ncbi:MAG: hypothetical protein HZB43_03310 [candidate division Zixibacteria bacterium]|nr:hypothetical protein [candidate division Zixibacteria bacterium]
MPFCQVVVCQGTPDSHGPTNRWGSSWGIDRWVIPGLAKTTQTQRAFIEKSICPPVNGEIDTNTTFNF